MEVVASGVANSSCTSDVNRREEINSQASLGEHVPCDQLTRIAWDPEV